MKNTIKALAVVSVSLLALGGSASALGEGQLEGGDIYRVKNVTKNSAFADPGNADKCETVQYKVRFHNPGPGVVTNVNVKVDLPQGPSTQNVSTVTATSASAQPNSRTDTATLNLASSLKVDYMSGSTELLDTNNAVIRSLPDGITTGGINVGDVGVSLNEIKFVQFKAKTECPVIITPAYSCDAFSITSDVNRTVKVSTFTTTATNGAVFKNAVVDWGDNSAQLTDANIIGKSHQYAKDGTYTITATPHFTVNGEDKTAVGPNCVKQVTFKGDKPVTPETPQTPQTPATTQPTTLVNTGPGEVMALFATVTAAGAAIYRRLLTRSLN